MGLWRWGSVLAFVPLGAATTVGCDSGCDKKSCMLPGVYLDIGLLQGATTATVCIDGECHTVGVLQRPELAEQFPESTLTVTDQRDLPAGEKVHLLVTISDGASTLATLDQHITVPSGDDECSCVSFNYHWVDDGFHRYT